MGDLLMNALTEWFGDCVVETVTVDGHLLRQPGHLPGAARFHCLTASGADKIVQLPFGNTVRAGESISVWNEGGANNIIVFDLDANLLATLAPGELATFYKRGEAIASQWLCEKVTILDTESVSMTRVPLDYVVPQDTVDFNLRDYWDAHGYDGESPAALRLWVGDASYSYIMGASTAALWGFDSGSWPSGSTLLLFNHGVVSGRGGDGGRGSDLGVGLLAQVGNAGGDAMRLRLPTALVNYGTIQGGGGGGGGGSRMPGVAAGGGGGGGAGHKASLGGLPGSGGGAQGGVGGGAYGAGGGGIGGASGPLGDGGAGGGPATAGSTAGAAGGAAGRSIVATVPGDTVIIRTGTILGVQLI